MVNQIFVRPILSDAKSNYLRFQKLTIQKGHFLALFTTSRIKTVRAGELDCPQDNQALQASTDFRIETGLSIVFI